MRSRIQIGRTSSDRAATPGRPRTGSHGAQRQSAHYTVSVIDVTKGAIAARIAVGGGPTGVAVHPVSCVIYGTNGPENTVVVIDPLTNKITRTIKIYGEPSAVAFTPNGGFVYVTGTFTNDGSVIDTTTYGTGRIPVGERPVGIAASPDGKCIYVANSGGNTVSARPGWRSAPPQAVPM